MIQIQPEMAEVIVATSTFFGAVALGLKKVGLLTFGRPSERRKCSNEITKVCGDHQIMRADIETIRENSKARLEKLNDMDAKISGVDSKVDGLACDMAKVVGFLQGKNGYHA